MVPTIYNQTILGGLWITRFGRASNRQDVVPQCDTDGRPSHDAIGDKGQDKQSLIQNDKGCPQIRSDGRCREEPIDINPNQENTTDFGTPTKKDGVMVYHLIFHGQIGRRGGQGVVYQKFRRAVFRHGTGRHEIPYLKDQDTRTQVFGVG
eukprot:scaffold2430_cov159-Amphora_coffeaeformis.AAC.4